MDNNNKKTEYRGKNNVYTWFVHVIHDFKFTYIFISFQGVCIEKICTSYYFAWYIVAAFFTIVIQTHNINFNNE